MKTKNFAKKGFTLIELLVVIVIIGILATIGVATFQGYFSKARDSEKSAAVRNMSTVLKTARAVETIIGFDSVERLENTANVGTTDPTLAAVSGVLTAEGGYTIPASPAYGEYYYITIDDDPNEFGIMVCGEENQATNEMFVDGTSTVVADVLATNTTICVSGAPVAPTEVLLDVTNDRDWIILALT